MRRWFASITLLLSLVVIAHADVYRPAYLQLKQVTQETFDVLWKVPARGDRQRLRLDVDFPKDVETVIAGRTIFVGNAFIETSTISRRDGLAGADIRIDGLRDVSTEVLVRIERLDGTTEVARLTAASPSFLVAAMPQFWQVVKTYLVFGVEHILQGLDHLLFVACLILIAGTWHRILITVTGFTIAHSITLSLAALELIRIPVPPIEASIALSIVFLAREIAIERRDTLTWRYPIAVSSTFGLLHGLGFASALSEIGLPQTEIPAALLAFNIGVEIGQIMFVGAVLNVSWIILWGLREISSNPVIWLHRLEKPFAYAVGGITMFWTIERVAQFWA